MDLTVKDIIDHLSTFPEDAPIAVCVFDATKQSFLKGDFFLLSDEERAQMKIESPAFAFIANGEVTPKTE